MANKNLTLEYDGLSDILKALNDIEDDVDDIVMQSAKAYGEQGVKDIQKSYLATFKNGSQGDYVYQSIGTRMVKPEDPNTIAWGGMGVYKIPSVEAKFGKTDKDFTSAQIAYWLEFGISRLKSGARKLKRISWGEVDSDLYVSTVPKPFVSKASMTGEEGRANAFAEKFNMLMDKI